MFHLRNSNIERNYRLLDEEYYVYYLQITICVYYNKFT